MVQKNPKANDQRQCQQRAHQREWCAGVMTASPAVPVPLLAGLRLAGRELRT